LLIQHFNIHPMIKNKLYIAAILLFSNNLIAQELNTTDSTSNLPTVIVSASKYPNLQKNTIQKVEVISAATIAQTNASTTADLLEKTGKLFVQKSQLGGGSPVIRGFEANRVLLMIDGIRLNNAIYRGGHLQNVISIDQSMLQSVEILHGPASTLYGSDAIGGAINFITKKVKYANTGSTQLSNISAYTRYASAAAEGTIHTDFTIADKTSGSLTSITVSRFGNLRTGANRNIAWQANGLRKWKVESINGVDTKVNNADVQNQVNSAYSQMDILQKFAFKHGKHGQHFVNLQYSNSSDVPRYDRLSEEKNGIPIYAEWYYGPQKRFLAAYKFELRNLNHFITDANAAINYQKIDEVRVNRKFGSINRTTNTEQVGVLGFDVNVRHKGEINELIIGADGQHNNVQSHGISKNIIDNTNSIANSRYPGRGSEFQNYSLYAQDNLSLQENTIVLNSGLRFTDVDLRGSFANDQPIVFPFNNIGQHNRALTGNLGLQFFPDDYFKISVGYSSGFRAPNLDDAGKVFESSNQYALVVPNNNLAPEIAHSVDVNIEYNENNDYKLGANAFFTRLQNAMVIDNFSLNGQDSALFNGTKLLVVALTNEAYANVSGVTAFASFLLWQKITMAANVAYTYGRYYPSNTFGNGNGIVPMDHIAPVYGRISATYQESKWHASLWSIFNGAKSVSQYNPLRASEDNLKYAPSTGTPAWATINVGGAYALSTHFQLQASVENIFDTYYRTFSSGISGAGRNLVLCIRYQ
jgi:hemoglobin/transferrin/lactoferrin receptor protein